MVDEESPWICCWYKALGWETRFIRYYCFGISLRLFVFDNSFEIRTNGVFISNHTSLGFVHRLTVLDTSPSSPFHLRQATVDLDLEDNVS